MTIRGVIFDLDGTLANTLPVCCAAFRPVLRDITGRQYSDPEIMALFGPNEEGILQQMAGDGWQQALQCFLSEYEAHHDTCLATFDGIDETLRHINESGARMAIITGKGAGSAAISVRRLGLDAYFDLIASGSATGVIKSQQIREVAEQWALPVEQVAYVGDTAYDMQHAAEAGATPIAAAWADTADRDALAATNPQRLFITVTDFDRWIRDHVCS
ncbi:MAG: HAD family hydrolase [Thermomicrobiales bacterium]|nr:HAD family hydrolase [Thermomicrobiales bacterium]